MAGKLKGMNPGKRLAWFRKRAGHTQDSLASATGLSRKHISGFETGANDISTRVLEALLRGCKTRMEEFYALGAKMSVQPEHEEAHIQLETILAHGDPGKVQMVKTLLDTTYDRVIEDDGDPAVVSN